MTPTEIEIRKQIRFWKWVAHWCAAGAAVFGLAASFLQTCDARADEPASHPYWCAVCGDGPHGTCHYEPCNRTATATRHCYDDGCNTTCCSDQGCVSTLAHCPTLHVPNEYDLVVTIPHYDDVVTLTPGRELYIRLDAYDCGVAGNEMVCVPKPVTSTAQQE